MMRLPGRLSRLVTASRLLALCLAVTTGLVVNVSAATAAAERPDFYQPPTPLPAGQPGDIIRHEPSKFYLDPLKLIEAPAEVHRIMYRSVDSQGNPMAVTGTVLTPLTPWLGEGPRPIVSFAVGTQGLGDKCAPSRQMAAGTEYEGAFISGLLLRGYGVVVTDYEGLGTPGVHTYAARKSQAHAVLDAIRAAQQLDAAGLPDDGPVATTGYSQGGGASAAAAEVQADYAPELDFQGSYAGAVPANLAAVGKFLDGSYAVAFLFYAAAGLGAAYPDAVEVDEILNERGEKIYNEIIHQCTLTSLPKYLFTDTSELTEDGRPLSAYLSEEPFKSILEENRIGKRPPEAPVLVTHSVLDTVVPYMQAKQMATSWCEQGATVTFSTYLTPTHLLSKAATFPEAFAFLGKLFRDTEITGNCDDF